MKQKLFGAAALVAFILFGASCSQQEQSEFDLNSVTQEVVISATVTYSTGVDVNSTSYSIINSKPAAGRKVFVEVPYSEYTNPGAAAAGASLKIFETVTDENGAFTITIPTRSEGINAVIRMEEFTDFYNTYEKMGDDGKPVFKTELKNYSFSTPIPGLKPGAFKFPEEIVYNSQKIDVDQFDESVTMTGNVKLAIETAYRKGDFKPANKANVEFTIIYDAGTAAAQEFKFGTTTDAQGNYSITLPVKSLARGFNISGLKVLGIGENKFTHYDSDSTSMTVYGAYELLNFGNVPVGGSIAFRDIIDGTTYNLGTQNLLFTPYFNANITDASQAVPENWDPNLIGWAAGMPGFDESYDKIATLTGRVFMPALSSFGNGIYKPAEQSIVITGNAPYNVQFTAITDKNGNFSIDIPVQDDTDPAFAIQLKDDVQPFTFIDSEGQSTVYRKGNYTYKTKVTKQDAEWYEFGDVYFKYNVDGDERTDEWNDYLIGWYVDPDYTETVKVKGKIKFANEQSYGVGIYEDHNIIVTVRDVTNNRYFAIQTSNGTYDFDMPVKNSKAELNIVLFGANFKTYDFKHYPKYGEGYKVLEGTYTVNSTVYESKEEKDAWNNLGTKYMTIAEVGGLVSNCETYHDNLAGWLIRKDANNVRLTKSKKSTGVVKLAEEIGYMEGKMNPAKNMLIPVKIENDVVYVLTDKSGNISIDVNYKTQGDEPNLTVPAAPASDIPFEEFTHYVNPEGKTKILAGTYKCEQVRSDDAEWNDWGTLYYKFTPTDAVDGWDEYTKYISDWIYKKDFNFTKTVTGTVKIAKETAYLKGNYQTEEGLPVKIQLDADPNLIFIAKTDAQGKFSIDVPLEKEDDEPNVAVLGLVPGFDYDDFVHYVNAKGKTKTIEGKYQGKQILPEEAEWNDAGTIYYTFNPADPAAVENWNDYGKYIAGWVVKQDYNVSKTVTGAVKVAQETAYLKGDYNKSAKDIPVKIQLDGDPDLTFVTTTDAQGKFSVVVPLENADDEPVVAVLGLATGFDDDAFVHYVNAEGKTRSIEGTYKGQQILVENAEWNDAGTLYFKFNPADPAAVENWNDYGKYIAGWVVKQDYNINKTVTGAVKVAQETAYLKGDYNKSAKDIPVKIQLDGDPDLIFVTATDAQGKFSIVVPVEDEDDEPVVAVLGLATGFKEDAFVHYVNAEGKTKSIKGTYKGKQVEDEDAEWNEAGTFYYTFNPDDPTAVDNWNDYGKYIAGWVVKEGYNINKNVTGSVKVAQETGFIKGDYNKSAKDIPVKIQLDADPELIFVTTTDAQGKFNFVVPIEKEEDEPVVAILGLVTGFESKDFIHYVDAEGKTKTLKGTYQGNQVVSADAEWNDAGIIYFTFNPDNAATIDYWNDFSKYTAGWIYKDGYNINKTVTGTIKVAQETGYLLGEYKLGNNIPVKIQLNYDASLTFATITDAQGKFTMPVIVEKDTDEPVVSVLGLGYGAYDGFDYKNFVHYVDATGKTKNLDGKYKGEQIKDEFADWNDAGLMIYKFFPNNDANKPAEWETLTKYTAGWTYKKGYDIIKNVTGTIKIAQETGYLTGDFEADAQYTPVKVQVVGDAANRTYVVPADENGNFQIGIQVEDENDEPVVALALPDLTKNDFIDYVNAAGNIKKISGVFTADIVKESGTPWAELGTAYYTFTPDAPSALWTKYTQYTAGWFYKKGYKSTKIVSGSVKLAAETGFWKGDWSGNANGVPVLVQVDTEGDPALNPYYATATDESGTFSIEVALKNSTDEPNVAWASYDLTLAELNNYKFVHYYDPATGNKLNIDGKFVNGGLVRKAESKWNQLGTRYYKFSKSGVVENWTSQLCGWQVWPADYTNKLTIKGAIQKSLEEFKDKATEANVKWEYVPYAFATVTVTVNATDYAFRVAAESNGQFSIFVNKEDVPSDLTVVIVPDDITDTFKHWTDKNDKNTSIYLSGKYTSADNVDGSSPISSTSTNTYDLTKGAPYSAKLIYSYTGSKPDGWDDYTWDVDEK